MSRKDITVAVFATQKAFDESGIDKSEVDYWVTDGTLTDAWRLGGLSLNGYIYLDVNPDWEATQYILSLVRGPVRGSN